MTGRDRITSSFMVNRASENAFQSGGLRVYREYRDLGIAAATDELNMASI